MGVVEGVGKGQNLYDDREGNPLLFSTFLLDSPRSPDCVLVDTLSMVVYDPRGFIGNR